MAAFSFITFLFINAICLGSKVLDDVYIHIVWRTLLHDVYIFEATDLLIIKEYENTVINLLFIYLDMKRHNTFHANETQR